MNTNKLERELTEALGEDDPQRALYVLADRYAGEEAALAEIRAAAEVVAGLAGVGARLHAGPAPAGGPLQLPEEEAPRGLPRRFWRIALPAAAAAAAAILLAILGGPPRPAERPARPAQLASAPAQADSPGAPAELPEFRMPDMSLPSWPALEMPDANSTITNATFSVPTFTWPSLTERSSEDET